MNSNSPVKSAPLADIMSNNAPDNRQPVTNSSPSKMNVQIEQIDYPSVKIATHHNLGQSLFEEDQVGTPPVATSSNISSSTDEAEDTDVTNSSSSESTNTSEISKGTTVPTNESAEKPTTNGVENPTSTTSKDEPQFPLEETKSENTPTDLKGSDDVKNDKPLTSASPAEEATPQSTEPSEKKETKEKETPATSTSVISPSVSPITDFRTCIGDALKDNNGKSASLTLSSSSEVEDPKQGTATSVEKKPQVDTPAVDKPPVVTAESGGASTTRIPDTPESPDDSESNSSIRNFRKKTQVREDDKDPPSGDQENKPKRSRLPTQPFQSPLPELSLIARLNNKANEKQEDKEKLVIFYKYEFLAVRNEEGGFYVCQARQNVFKTSARIKIRWLSEKDNVFTPDFYDTTEFDCILTCIKLKRVEKEKWKLAEQEKERVQNILKRSLDTEKGIELPKLTEEHPDGLDLSLFRDESQLTKQVKGKASLKKKKIAAPSPKKTPVSKTPNKRVAPTPSSSSAVKRSLRSPKPTTSKASYDFDDPSSLSSEEFVNLKKSSKKKSITKKKKVASTSAIVAAKKKAANKDKTTPAKKASATKAKATSAIKKRTEASASPVSNSSTSSAKKTAKRKSNDTMIITPAAKKRVEPSKLTPPVSDRTTKTRNAGSAVEAKISSAATLTRTSRDRRGVTSRK